MGELKIVGGTDAVPGEYPYFAVVFANGYFICGGSLISPSLVMTARHCVKHFVDYSVSVGKWSVSDHGEQRRVLTVFNFPDESDQHDIAILKLDQKILSIDPIPLSFLTPNDGDKTTVIGFGRMYYNDFSFNYTCSACNLSCSDSDCVYGETSCNETFCVEKPAFPSHLQEVGLTVSDPLICKIIYGSYFDAKVMFCAYEVFKDSCQGDSGGPIFDSNKRQIGLVSYGYGCASVYPGVYVNIYFYKEWINYLITNVDSPEPRDGLIIYIGVPALLILLFITCMIFAIRRR